MSVSEAHKHGFRPKMTSNWKPHTKRRRQPGKVQFSTDVLYTRASLSMNRTLNAVHCDRRIVLVWFFFLVKPVEFDINHGFDSVPETMAKHWMSVGYCPPIAHSPFAYPLQWNRTTAHCPPCARPMECHQWPRPERDSASAPHPDRRIMLILSCEVLHYFFGIVSVAILLDYVTHCLRDEHFSPVLLWIVMKLI